MVLVFSFVKGPTFVKELQGGACVRAKFRLYLSWNFCIVGTYHVFH
ncbi:hypothetical protein OSB04_003704 [Centaurea solstitialis]|uniref:Uncharacterized protein n=1 Tax=Centaurea solstitialis TaxID=347529 RepID=A0AA38U2V4_9ASTR|nr:hypothetical protein OSB04_003704 [Centaurea solstitialis]